MRSWRNAPRPTRLPWTRMSRCCLGSSSLMPGMLRHQQQLLGQVGHGRMISPGPQLDAEVADALHARLVLDRSKELERLDAELAGLIDLALVDTDRGLVGEVAGALLGRVWVQRPNGLLKHGVSRFGLSQADVDLAFEASQPGTIVVVEPSGRGPGGGVIENAFGSLQSDQALGRLVRPGLGHRLQRHSPRPDNGAVGHEPLRLVQELQRSPEVAAAAGQEALVAEH